jgi:hypothetical protein
MGRTRCFRAVSSSVDNRCLHQEGARHVCARKSSHVVARTRTQTRNGDVFYTQCTTDGNHLTHARNTPTHMHTCTHACKSSSSLAASSLAASEAHGWTMGATTSTPTPASCILRVLLLASRHALLLVFLLASRFHDLLFRHHPCWKAQK